MRVDLDQFLAMPPAVRGRVSHLDLICDGDRKKYWNFWPDPERDEAEEYVGERRDRGLRIR